MKYVSPIIPERIKDEFRWGKGSIIVPAVVVNEEEKTGTLVQRFKLSWKERIRILFGQNLFVWFVTYDQRPQWPYISVENPDVFPGKVYPIKRAEFLAKADANLRKGVAVYNPPGSEVEERLEPTLEEEIYKTISQKRAERAVKS